MNPREMIIDALMKIEAAFFMMGLEKPVALVLADDYQQRAFEACLIKDCTFLFKKTDIITTTTIVGFEIRNETNAKL